MEPSPPTAEPPSPPDVEPPAGAAPHHDGQLRVRSEARGDGGHEVGGGEAASRAPAALAGVQHVQRAVHAAHKHGAAVGAPDGPGREAGADGWGGVGGKEGDGLGKVEQGGQQPL